MESANDSRQTRRSIERNSISIYQQAPLGSFAREGATETEDTCETQQFVLRALPFSASAFFICALSACRKIEGGK